VLIAFLMAAFLAGVITYFFTKRMRASRSQHETSQIVAAVNDIPSGSTLTAKDVALVDWPTNLAMAGSYDKLDDVIGRPLLYPLVAREPVLKRDLGQEGSGIGISGKIPTGMRATAVKSNEIVGVAGFLYPGSRVDVLVTYTPPGGASGSSPLTQTVLQNVEVLAAGQTIEPDPQGKPETVNVVTLLVSPEDSQKLQLASSQGTIQFVLRSGVDQKSVDLRPTRLDQLSSEKPAPAPAPPGKKVARKVQVSAPVYTMEVIQGTKRTEEKF
jgi:pilus assembly protein CpaB